MDMNTLSSTFVRHLVLVTPWLQHTDEQSEMDNRSVFQVDDPTTMVPSMTMSGTNSTDAPSAENNAMDIGMMIITLVFFWAFVTLTLILVVKDCRRGQCPQQSDSAATALEEGLSEDERMEKQRLERRLWYQYYLKPYTIILSEKNFVTDDKLTNTNIYEKEDEEVADVENQIDASTETQTPVDESEQLPIPMPTHATEEEEDTGESDLPPPPPPIPAPCQLERRYTSYSSPTVQVWDPVEDCYTRVEGNCAICINDYQVGDVLVRSAAGKGEEYCTHLYHYDCMLVWLEKGKKRCPICRHWFVPALRIKEQMKQEHVSLSQSRHHLFGMHNDCLASVAPTSNTSHSAHDESDHSNHNDDEHTTTSSVNNAAISLEEPPGASRLYDV